MTPTDVQAPAEPAFAWWLPLLGVGAIALVILLGWFFLTGRWWNLMALGWRAFGLGLIAVGAIGITVWVWLSPGWVKVLAVFGAAGLVLWRIVRRRRSSSTVTRWGERARRTQGVASSWGIWRTGGARAARAKATVVRPSLGDLPSYARLAMRTREVGVALARVGAQTMYASVEDVVLTFGGPRTGKSGWLAGRIIDAPGACVVTSTRPDLYQLTAPLREGRGPVSVFNAVGLGGIPSTIGFDPLIGCQSPVTAVDRATDMLAAGSTSAGSGDREFWEQQARRVLGAFLHAAALGDRTMSDVLRWVTDPDGSRSEVTRLLRKSEATNWVADAAQFIGTNDRTRSSITSSIMPALGWLTSPAAVAASTHAVALDVEALLRERGTVYLLGGDESQTAPLVCALTGHIAREARRLAAAQPGGRLDPPLQLDLDEAALISPVPLESWTSDMGGRGVTILAAFQSFRQVTSRWGEDNAGVILTNAGAILLFGGSRDPKDLDLWVRLAGTREERATSRDKHGRPTGSTTRKVDVLSGAQLANLPSGHAVVFRKGLPPAVGRVRMAWKRRDVRRISRATRQRRWVTTPTPAHQSPARPGEAGGHA